MKMYPQIQPILWLPLERCLANKTAVSVIVPTFSGFY